LYNPADPPAYIFNLGNAATSVKPWVFIDAGVAVVVGDATTGAALLNPPGGLYGSVNTGSTRVFSYPTNTIEERETLMTFLEDIIPDNDYVFLFTVQRPGFSFEPEEWAQDSVTLGKNLFSVLESQGAQSVRGLETNGTVPYTFIYQKNNSPLDEDLAATIDEQIFTEVFIPVNHTAGNMGSTIVGPAKEWKSLAWNVSGGDDSIADTTYISIFGLDENQNEILLVDRVYSKDTTLNFIDANVYSRLKLTYTTDDTEDRSPGQLDYWRVFYTELPDAAINPDAFYSFNSDTLQQGQQMSYGIAIENISEQAMDSVLVKLSVIDQSNNQLVQSKRYPPLGVDETINAMFDFDTETISNSQQIVFEVNPDDDQPELHRFNNFAISNFFINQDNINPLLDVTFDGRHILSGDLVSSKPNIYISLKDENEFLALSDTSIFKIFIRYPGQSTSTVIPFESDVLTFFPATQGGQNKAYIELNPTFEVDGIYELLVQAEDASGNQSGDIDYKVSFEVVTKSSISNIVNYPNPFTTSTQFAYTLTGNEVPEFFKIQIFTVSGKIVKEITQDEIGPLRIGTHLTDYKWNGTDEYGGRLANGTYLYRLVTENINGEKIESFRTQADKFFTRGFGKLVILR